MRGEVLHQRTGELRIVRLFALLVPRLMLSGGIRLYGLHFLFVLVPDEAAIDGFKRNDCTYEGFFLLRGYFRG